MFKTNIILFVMMVGVFMMKIDQAYGEPLPCIGFETVCQNAVMINEAKQYLNEPLSNAKARLNNFVFPCRPGLKKWTGNINYTENKKDPQGQAFLGCVNKVNECYSKIADPTPNTKVTPAQIAAIQACWRSACTAGMNACFKAMPSQEAGNIIGGSSGLKK